MKRYFRIVRTFILNAPLIINFIWINVTQICLQVLTNGRIYLFFVSKSIHMTLMRIGKDHGNQYTVTVYGEFHAKCYMVDMFCDLVFRKAAHQDLSEKGNILKGKNLLPRGVPVI